MDTIKVDVDKESLSKFVGWLYEKSILYGKPFESWWSEKGCMDFLKYAKDKFDAEYK